MRDVLPTFAERIALSLSKIGRFLESCSPVVSVLKHGL